MVIFQEGMHLDKLWKQDNKMRIFVSNAFLIIFLLTLQSCDQAEDKVKQRSLYITNDNKDFKAYVEKMLNIKIDNNLTISQFDKKIKDMKIKIVEKPHLSLECARKKEIKQQTYYFYAPQNYKGSGSNIGFAFNKKGYFICFEVFVGKDENFKIF
jgi:hypothetical protein